jgi:hypothetical protein
MELPTVLSMEFPSRIALEFREEIPVGSAAVVPKILSDRVRSFFHSLLPTVTRNTLPVLLELGIPRLLELAIRLLLANDIEPTRIEADLATHFSTVCTERSLLAALVWERAIQPALDSAIAAIVSDILQDLQQLRNDVFGRNWELFANLSGV